MYKQQMRMSKAGITTQNAVFVPKIFKKAAAHDDLAVP